MASVRHQLRAVGAATVVAGSVLLALIAIDLLGGATMVLIPLFAVAPMIAATSGPPEAPLWVGGAGAVAAVALGPANDLWGTSRQAVGVAVVVAGTVLAWRLAVVRDRREQSIARAAPMMERAVRLTRAMHAGGIGEWWWDRATGAVGWDDEVHRLFGVTPGSFAGTFEEWVASIHPDDRAEVLDTLQAGIDARSSFRFDHRCVWPDGTEHWVEGIGEVVLDTTGELSGAAGLAWDVDERHRQLDERARLLEVEHAARLRAEYVARSHEALSRSVDLDEILRTVTEAAVPEVADWCTAVLSYDRPLTDPIIVAAHRDADMRRWADDLRRRFPYNPDSEFGAARVIRSGRREVLGRVSEAGTGLPDGVRDTLAFADVDNVVTVPIVGTLGILGALQFIRGRDRPAFSESDIDVIEDLATRCGAALHTAILFTRQRIARSALETLQQVSGGLARALTRLDVATAAMTHGIPGLRADGAVLFVRTDGGSPEPELTALAMQGSAADQDLQALEEIGRQSIVDDRVTWTPLGAAETVSVLATPLRIRDRSTGSLMFLVERDRVFTDDELSMLFTLGSRCAGALERAGLYERDREIALTLQRRLLPALPEMPGWLTAGARYEPATGGQIGGDWFQVLPLEDGGMIAAVGDAVGHGMTSAAAMGQLRASIETAVSIDHDPGRALQIVDRFAAQGADTRGASVMLALLDEHGTLYYASAGHPPSVMLRGDGRTQVMMEGRRPLLGFGGPDPWDGITAATHFEPGDTLVVFTDGLVERHGEALDLGLDRVCKTCASLHGLPVQKLCDELVDRMRSAAQTDDDIAVLVIRRR